MSGPLRFHLEFDFHDELDLGGLLRRLADRLDLGAPEQLLAMPVRDVNGNTIGSVSIQAVEP